MLLGSVCSTPSSSCTTVTKLRFLFDQYMESGIAFLRSNLKELAPTCNNNLAQSLMRILDCYMERYYIKEGRDDPTDSDFQTLGKQIEHLFFFALVWSVGCTTNEKGRAAFDGWLRSEMESNSQEALFPDEGMVYDYSYDLENSKWVYWMNTIKKYEIDPKASFAELVVPTNDSVRNNYLMDLLLMKQKHVLMVGETGTGKTINISQYILGQSKIGMMEKPIDSNCIPVNIAFSAQTSQNMTQDMLDAKMEKRRKGIFGPAAGKQYIVYVDDLNMPKREEYGAQPPIEILRQWFDQSGWYDRKELTFRTIIDLTFICSMGPPGGGRQDVTARFLRHFNMIGYVELSDASKAIIFETILGDFLGHFEARVDNLVKPMVSATIDLFNNIIESLLPTPAKSHYTFNLRDLAKVFQGTLMCEPKKVTGGEDVVRVWVHECKRVFADRLTNATDREWFEKTTRNLVSTKFEMDYDEIVNVERLIYGDYMIRGADPRLYEQVTDMAKLKLTIEEYLEDYNTDQRGAGMPLVMFMDAIEHVSKVARVLRQPMGNCLLLGVGGSGRQSMTKLATYVSGFKMFQVEIVKGYGMAEWREDIKNCLLVAGTKNVPTTFLFSDTQIVDETMLEDINNILNAGEVPNLFPQDELDKVCNDMAPVCKAMGIIETRENCFLTFVQLVKQNLHIVLGMSPVGDSLRIRCRNFPSLINCTTIDWFHPWPAAALVSVASVLLADMEMPKGMEEVKDGLINMCQTVHSSVSDFSDAFFSELRRKVYTTPKSYLDLIALFTEMLTDNQAKVDEKRERMEIGVAKLDETEKVRVIARSEGRTLLLKRHKTPHPLCFRLLVADRRRPQEGPGEARPRSGGENRCRRGAPQEGRHRHRRGQRGQGESRERGGHRLKAGCRGENRQG